MVLVDTSVWIDHFHKKDIPLIKLLDETSVCIHPFIIGELACGNLKNRNEILTHLQSLPQISVAEHNEVLYFINKNKMHGRGLGYIDIHLITSCFIDKIKIYTRDKRLKFVAEQFDLLYMVKKKKESGK